jgi:hypothetical protein
MLAFQTVVAQGKKSGEASAKIIGLAKRMNEFCNLNVEKAFPVATINFAEDREAEQVDDAIQKHIDKLRTKELTNLPENRGA